jgi:HPt (histidine-containing phosphotransfer) domain-containing protein
VAGSAEAPHVPNLLDEGLLEALYDDFASTDDLPALANLIANFLERGAAQIERVSDAISTGDGTAIRATGHQLKGSCRMLGAALAAAIAAEVEAAGEAGDTLAARRWSDSATRCRWRQGDSSRRSIGSRRRLPRC